MTYIFFITIHVTYKGKEIHTVWGSINDTYASNSSKREMEKKVDTRHRKMKSVTEEVHSQRGFNFNFNFLKILYKYVNRYW